MNCLVKGGKKKKDTRTSLGVYCEISFYILLIIDTFTPNSLFLCKALLNILNILESVIIFSRIYLDLFFNVAKIHVSNLQSTSLPVRNFAPVELDVLPCSGMKLHGT